MGGNKAMLENPHGADLNKYMKAGAPKPDFRRSRAAEPTVEQIKSDNLTTLARNYWAPGANKAKTAEFDPAVVEQIYKTDIKGSQFSIKRVMMLEFSQYLENFLWPNYTAETSSLAHLLSIVVIVNEKFRERVPAWTAFQLRPDQFPSFFNSVLRWTVSEPGEISVMEQTMLVVFLDHCFTSMEVDLVRTQVQRLVSLPMWCCILEARREAELKSNPKWKKYWKLLSKKDAKESPENLEKLQFERTFLSKMIKKFLKVLYTIQEKECPEDHVDFVERFLILIIDLEALLPTRRFFNTVLDDSHLVVRASLAPLVNRPEGRLFTQLLEQVRFYTRFEINDQTGEPLTDRDMMALHYKRLSELQRAVFVKYPELRSLALATIASIEDREQLEKHFLSLSRETLYQICLYLHLVPSDQGEEEELTQQFLAELVISRHEKRDSQLTELNSMPLYPTEEFIWDENLVPGEYYQGENPLALPKLNLQFLTLHDYLLRNFKLFQLESTYEIRQDIEDVIARMRPWRAEDGSVIYNGWARMALPLQSFTIVEVAKPNIGEKQPSRVRADVTVHLGVRDNVKQEWENLRRHDVCFLLTLRPPMAATNAGYLDIPAEEYCQTTGLMYVRGCEVEGMLDENGRVIEEFGSSTGADQKPKFTSNNRTFRVVLDSNQYREDMDMTSQGSEDVYSSFNVLMRRKPKENNFKAVLETIRDLMNTACVVPDWLHDIILGYGDPASAHYSNMPNNIPTLNFNDTFLDFDHLRLSFPGYEVKVPGEFSEKDLLPPFKVCFEDIKTMNLKRDEPGDDKPAPVPRVITVEPVRKENRGPYPKNIPKVNSVRFTPTQVEAIRAGTNPGLTMVVGPPGTGKTDVAVQIISNLYHNFPNQRTLIVTHSNQALNQLFEKIMALDIDERHLLRLGHGEEALETEKDFSRYGRVNYVLAKRLELLDEVTRLQKSLGVAGEVGYTCETARYFYLYQVLSRWEEFLAKLEATEDEPPKQVVEDIFPFHVFFANAPKPLFHGPDYPAYLECAMSCWRYIEDIFKQLDEFWAFELLRSGLDRTRYLCVKEAKIIAMTCTHAALKRQELVQLGFKYDNILMEESAQILEIETFIPLLLQNPQDGTNRLKRWIMIGDHHQLPPVVKNMAFEKFSNMEQSLFTRLVRLGVPSIQLDAQGRSRPSICSLYNWRYKALGNLPHVLSNPEYKMANSGFSFDYQLINVLDFNGVGESQPSPFFYQNLAEAEYVVAVYMYMRMIGYPASRISILTTYNGQKALIRDVANARCSDNPLIGMPHKIATVDKYQGQQNDFILLSLVRTYNVGHLRDVRRLVVAMSRARLGLYVFARVSLFKNCFELQPAFNILTKRPLQLHLCPGEVAGGCSRVASVTAPNPVVVHDMPTMSKFVVDFYQKKVKELKTLQARLAPQPGQLQVQNSGQRAAVHPGGDRDSDDEAEGKNKFVSIVNEVETEQVEMTEVSGENKAAQALEKVFSAESETEGGVGEDTVGD